MEQVEKSLPLYIRLPELIETRPCRFLAVIAGLLKTSQEELKDKVCYGAQLNFPP